MLFMHEPFLLSGMFAPAMRLRSNRLLRKTIKLSYLKHRFYFNSNAKG